MSAYAFRCISTSHRFKSCEASTRNLRPSSPADLKCKGPPEERETSVNWSKGGASNQRAKFTDGLLPARRKFPPSQRLLPLIASARAAADAGGLERLLPSPDQFVPSQRAIP